MVKSKPFDFQEGGGVIFQENVQGNDYLYLRLNI